MPGRESRWRRASTSGDGVVGLRRCSSAQHHAARRIAAGPQELVRTVSQRLRGLISGAAAALDTGEIVSSSNRSSGGGGAFLERECGGDAKAKIISEEHNGRACRIRLSLSPQKFRLLSTSTGDEEQGLDNDHGSRRTRTRIGIEEQEEGEEEARILSSPKSPGCFSLMRSISSSRWKISSNGNGNSSSSQQDLGACTGKRSNSSSSSSQDLVTSSSRKFCRGSCFGSTRLPEELPDSSVVFEEKDLIDLDRRRHQDEQQQQQLPDEVVEMFLARLPFDSLVRARAVCKTWRDLTKSPHFVQLRESVRSPRPWLFVLGLSRDGVSLGQIQALDPTLDRWHLIRAEPLAGRLLYSVASIGSTLFVVGGCSARASSDREKGGFLKTHRSVLVLDGFTGSWSKAGSGMRAARTTPVVAVFEMTEAIRLKLFTAPDKTKPSSSGRGGIAWRKRSAEIGVFRGSAPSSSSRIMDMVVGRRCHAQRSSSGSITSRDSSFRQVDDQVATTKTSAGSSSLSSKAAQTGSSNGARSGSGSSYGLIVIGGQDERNQTLCSGEVYDLASGSWSREVAAWPSTEFGSLCTGVVSKGVLYCYSDSDKVVALDIEKNSWYAIAISSSGIPSRIQDYLPKLVACNGKILLAGVAWASRLVNGFEQQAHQTQQQPKAARKIWRLDPSDDRERIKMWRWTEVSQHPDAPLDWNAVFIGHGDRVFGVEMFKIFGQVLDFVTVCEFAAASSRRRKRPSWDRVSKHRMGQDVDSSSCLTKLAVIVQL